MPLQPSRDFTACGQAKPLFLVSKAWAEGFFSSEPSSKITNAPLVDLSKGCHQCRQVVLRQGLKEGEDFVVVSADKWAKLCNTYGTDYEICRFRVVPERVVVKGNPLKMEKKAKQVQKRGSTEVATEDPGGHPTPTNGKQPLVLFPACAALFLQDPEDANADNDDGITQCSHRECNHQIRIPLDQCTQMKALRDLARVEITNWMELDSATYTWLLPSSRRGYRIDCMYYDRELKMWKLWFPRVQLQVDARAMLDKTLVMKFCVRARMTDAQKQKHFDGIANAEDKLRELQRKRKASTETAEGDESEGSQDKPGERATRSAKRAAVRRRCSRVVESESDEEIEAADPQ